MTKIKRYEEIIPEIGITVKQLRNQFELTDAALDLLLLEKHKNIHGEDSVYKKKSPKAWKRLSDILGVEI